MSADYESYMLLCHPSQDPGILRAFVISINRASNPLEAINCGSLTEHFIKIMVFVGLWFEFGRAVNFILSPSKHENMDLTGEIFYLRQNINEIDGPFIHINSISIGVVFLKVPIKLKHPLVKLVIYNQSILALCQRELCHCACNTVPHDEEKLPP